MQRPQSAVLAITLGGRTGRLHAATVWCHLFELLRPQLAVQAFILDAAPAGSMPPLLIALYFSELEAVPASDRRSQWMPFGQFSCCRSSPGVP